MPWCAVESKTPAMCAGLAEIEAILARALKQIHDPRLNVS
jgi:hypothetical protein